MRLPLSIASAVLSLSVIFAQSAAFEVATVKPTAPGTYGDAFALRGNRFLADNQTLKGSIAFAYHIAPKLISGGPDWINSDHFDIVGEAPGDVRLTLDRALPMFQALLAERFHLKFHREQREMPVYELAPGKNELQLKPSTAPPDQPGSLLIRPGGFRVMRLPARNTTMADFVALLERMVVDRPVVDRTGLTGHYDFTLEWRFEGPLSARGGPLPDDLGEKPDIFTAIRTLGLRLEPAKAPVETLVIDRAEKPDAN